MLARKLSGKIPPLPEKNPYTRYNGDEEMFLHYDIVNMDDCEIFPYPEYRIIVYDGEPMPPCFYVYCRNTAIAVDMESGEIVGIKKHGKNSKIIRYVGKNLWKWLFKENPTPHIRKSNWDVIRDSIWGSGWYFNDDGKLDAARILKL